jgi:membrane protein
MSKKSFARLIRIVTGTFGTAKDEIFSFESNLTRFEKFVHFWVLVARSYVRNRCPVRAAALSYTTLLALVPTLAVGMSLSSWLLKSKGEEQIGAFIEQFIAYIVPDDRSPDAMKMDIEWEFATPVETSGSNAVSAVPETTLSDTNAPVADPASLVNDARVVAVKQRAAAQIREFIQNASSGALGTFGGFFLFWTAIMMLIRMEETFNDIWGVTRGRDWWARITNYFFTIVFGPALLMTAIGLASGPRFQKTRNLIGLMPFLEPLVSQLLPVIIISITFALVYKLMPNTKVRFSAALAGGSLAGTSWYLFNVFSLYLGSSAVNASKIYGSLFLVPLLMVGLYVVWVIVLFGAQVAYAFQNRESYMQERIAENVNQRGREFVALRLMTCIGQNFHRGLPPASVQQMSRELGIPSKLVQQVLQTLLAARLVVEVHGLEPGYVPARPLETINCHHILLAMRATQGQELVTREEPVREEVFGEFARIQAAEKEAATTVSMLALVNRAQARLELTPPNQPAMETKNATPVVELTELPQEPASATAPEDATNEATMERETKPIAPATSAAREAAPTAAEDKLSFPL